MASKRPRTRPEVVESTPLPSEPRIIEARSSGDDDRFDRALRPTSLDDYIGQSQHKANLKVFVEAARRRGEPLDHILLFGPPGLGKTTLSMILAREMGVELHMTSGPAIDHKGMLASLLTSLGERDALFIDEINLRQVPGPSTRIDLSGIQFSAVVAAELPTTVAQVLAQAAAFAHELQFIEIEVETLNQLEQALTAGAKMVLLDNMSLDQLRQAVQINAGRAVLEVSGGVNMTTVRDIAATGVDRISIGALTKDVQAVDFSMRFEKT